MLRGGVLDALIFDLDGTLWDTTATCALAWNRVLGRLGLARRVTAADVRAVTGKSHFEAIQAAFPELSGELLQRLSDETAVEDNVAIAERDSPAPPHLFPGVLELVPALRARRPLCIVSNCQQGYIENFLALSGLGEHFVDFECWGNTGRDKATNLRSVMARNHLATPLFVGDTEGDRAAARANGVRFAHATWGYGAVEEADHVLVRFDELLAL